MTRLAPALLLLAAVLAGCARHVVVEPRAMRLDRERGTGSLSDPEWIVLSEPRAEDAEPEPAPL